MSAAVLHTVHLASVPPQPWRNGGGSTQELLAWPTAADWQCRISVARIDSNGPFSAFPGIERWFTVLSGEGVVLRFGQRRTLLTAGSEPLRFEGAAAPGCDLLDGPTLDLNLMLKSDCGRGAMRAAPPGDPWQAAAPLRAVFTTAATTLSIDGQAARPLAAGTLAWCDGAAHQWWQLGPAGAAAGGAPNANGLHGPLATAADATPHAWWLHFMPRPS